MDIVRALQILFHPEVDFILHYISFLKCEFFCFLVNSHVIVIVNVKKAYVRIHYHELWNFTSFRLI